MANIVLPQMPDKVDVVGAFSAGSNAGAAIAGRAQQAVENQKQRNHAVSMMNAKAKAEESRQDAAFNLSLINTAAKAISDKQKMDMAEAQAKLDRALEAEKIKLLVEENKRKQELHDTAFKFNKFISEKVMGAMKDAEKESALPEPGKIKEGSLDPESPEFIGPMSPHFLPGPKPPKDVRENWLNGIVGRNKDGELNISELKDMPDSVIEYRAEEFGKNLVDIARIKETRYQLNLSDKEKKEAAVGANMSDEAFESSIYGIPSEEAKRVTEERRKVLDSRSPQSLSEREESIVKAREISTELRNAAKKERLNSLNKTTFENSFPSSVMPYNLGGI